ncbi:MAG TPA: hypothetical protein VN976_11900 [Verrucomicrobiae bacterium]|nr:hypothetical protein [Verrucomicrobiae bacterium]
MKPPRRLIFLLVLVVSFAFLVSAQDGGPSLGDIARQERARKMAQTDANEIAGLKEGGFHLDLLLMDSKDSVLKWVSLPAADRPNAGRIRQVTRDKKIYLPFVVTDYPFPLSEKMNLTAHIRFLSPQGKVLLDNPTFSETIGADPRSPHTIVLNPVMDITFDSSDLPGTYTFRLTVVDHVHSTYAKAEEKIELIQAKGKTESGELDKSPAVVPTSGTR